MEKIQQALEKAGRERDRLPPPSTAPTAPGPAPAVDPSYGSTRVVAIDADNLKERRIVAGLDFLETADAFRILRTSVVRRMTPVGATTLAITSPGMAEGKTVVAANLAVSLSRFAQNTVLLVDLDLRRPNLHNVFGLDAEPGLTDYLIRDTPLAECLVSPGIDRLVLLPCGTPLRTSSEALSSQKMTALAGELKTRYPERLVLYDLPPLLPTDDALVFLKHVDASLLVVEEGGTRRADIERAMELLKDYHPIGTVLNKARSAKGQYGYY